MADSKHTITIKSEDGGKSRGVSGSEPKLDPADFMKLFQQEVNKLKEAILQENPEMSRGEAQRQAQREVSEQLQTTRRRNEGVIEPSSTGDDEELKLAPPIEINPRTILPEDPIGFEEDSDEDIARSQDMLRKMASSRNEPTKSPGVDPDEGIFDDSSDQLKSTVSEKDEDEDFSKNLLDKEERNASLRAVFGVDSDEGTFDDSDDQLQDDVEGSAEASDTEEEDETKQLVAASTEEEDKSGGFLQRQGGKLGGVAGRVAGTAIGGTLGAIGGSFIGQPMLGASIGGSIAGAAGSAVGQAVGQGVGAVAGGATQFVGGAIQTTTGDATGAAAATAGGFATASEGVLKSFGDLAGMIPGVGGILEAAFDGLAEAIGPVAEGFVQLFSAMDKASEEVAAFNPGILGERIETDLDMLFKKMERAQQAGDEFAEFEAAKGDMMSVFEDVKTGLFKILGPLVTLGTKLLTRLLELFLDWLPTIGEFIAALLEGLAWIVDWFDGSGVSAAQQAILDTAVSVRKAAKEVEQWHDEDKEKEQKNYMGEIDQWLTGGFLENDHIGAVGPAPPGVL
tara:strand:- start:19400 stop:21097 length:1698 start_codon:yes stop_codon:yes gene_type:complete